MRIIPLLLHVSDILFFFMGTKFVMQRIQVSVFIIIYLPLPFVLSNTAVFNISTALCTENSHNHCYRCRLLLILLLLIGFGKVYDKMLKH